MNKKRPQIALKSRDAEGMVTVNTNQTRLPRLVNNKPALLKHGARAALVPDLHSPSHSMPGLSPTTGKNSNGEQKMFTDQVTFGLQSPEIYRRAHQDVTNMM